MKAVHKLDGLNSKSFLASTDANNCETNRESEKKIHCGGSDPSVPDGAKSLLLCQYRNSGISFQGQDIFQRIEIPGGSEVKAKVH